MQKIIGNSDEGSFPILPTDAVVLVRWVISQLSVLSKWTIISNTLQIFKFPLSKALFRVLSLSIYQTLPLIILSKISPFSSKCLILIWLFKKRILTAPIFDASDSVPVFYNRLCLLLHRTTFYFSFFNPPRYLIKIVSEGHFYSIYLMFLLHSYPFFGDWEDNWA